MTTRGRFILLEGGDRVGKTTQSTILVERLNAMGRPSVVMRFPNRATRIGSMLDRYLTLDTTMEDHALYMLFVANRWEHMDVLRAHLDQGTNVVVDRFSYSGAAYSRLDLDWCMSMESGLPRCDTMLYLDLSPSQACARGGWGAERFETREIQTRVRARFQRLKTPDWHVLDAGVGREVLSESIMSVVIPLLDETPGSLKYMC